MITTLTYIHCDHCNEPHRVDPYPNQSKYEALTEAKKVGYSRVLDKRKRIDLCYDCFKEHQHKRWMRDI